MMSISGLFVWGTEMFYLAVIIILASLILGGGTSHGFVSDATLQFVAVPILIISLWLASIKPSHGQAKLARFFCLIILSIPLLQLIPLPPEIWTTLPGREKVRAALKLTFDPLPWMPLSLAPRATWLSFLAMLPPLAVFMVVHQLDDKERQKLSLVIIAFGIISVFLGLLQLAQGSSSDFRFFEFTNPTESVGFFANRNHYAASLYAIIMLVAAWLLKPSKNPHRGDAIDMSKMLYLLVGFTIIVIFIAGQLMTRSRSGLGLTVIALGGIYLMSLTGLKKREKSRKRLEKLAWAGIILVGLFSSQFALFRIMDRFEAGLNEGFRITLAQITKKAAWENMPFGTGLGSYVPVFKQYETTDTLIHGHVYANHAHNDFLESWLETGLIGWIIFTVFSWWYLAKIYQVWGRPLINSPPINQLLAKAATIIIGLFLIHCLASYPLRTAANMSIFVFSCALLIRTPETVHIREN